VRIIAPPLLAAFAATLRRRMYDAPLHGARRFDTLLSHKEA
jgi:hypothetical protein